MAPALYPDACPTPLPARSSSCRPVRSMDEAIFEQVTGTWRELAKVPQVLRFPVP